MRLTPWLAPCFALLTVASLSLASCADSSTRSGVDEATTSSSAAPTGRDAVEPNPFGVMLPSQLVRSPEGMQVARELGAAFYRPASIVLDRWDGRCGRIGDISIYGQELNYTTWRLAKMNLAIRGIDGRIEQPAVCGPAPRQGHKRTAPGEWNHAYP